MITIFECKNCKFQSAHHEGEVAPMFCPDCKSKFYKLRYCKDIKKKAAHVNIDGTSRDCERWSDALGINPEQEGDFRKAFPHLDLEFNREGQCKVKNWQHQKQIMKARGYDDGGKY